MGRSARFLTRGMEQYKRNLIVENINIELARLEFIPPGWEETYQFLYHLQGVHLPAKRGPRKQMQQLLTRNRIDYEFCSRRVEALYWELVAYHKKNDLRPFIQTGAEKHFGHFLRQHSKFKFSTSVLIGRHVVDYFFYYQGLAVELDGAVHGYSETKMKKDLLRDNRLYDLGIPVYVVQNETRVREVVKLIEVLRKRENQLRLSTNSVSALKKRIYAATIAMNMSCLKIAKYLCWPHDLLFKCLDLKFPRPRIKRFEGGSYEQF